MQIAILVLLVAVLVLAILVLVKVSYNKTLIKSLAQTVAKVYDFADKLDTSVEALMLWMKDNKAEYKGLLSKIIESQTSANAMLTKILESLPSSGTTIVDEDGKVINTLAFSQRKGERKLKVIQPSQQEVVTDEEA
jgi:predicted PurR-regulated permease PerM